jgi:hypothetical protein
MKAARTIPILLLIATASAAYVWFRLHPETPCVPEPIALPGREPSGSLTNEAPAEEAQVPVQPLEERGDAMLFEIEALQNTPFDEAVVQPFD